MPKMQPFKRFVDTISNDMQIMQKACVDVGVPDVLLSSSTFNHKLS